MHEDYSPCGRRNIRNDDPETRTTEEWMMILPK